VPKADEGALHASVSCARANRAGERPTSRATRRRTPGTEVLYVDAQDVITNETACVCDAPKSHSIGIVDFYCAELKLVIELDGTHHRSPGTDEYDDRRTAYLR
jgi:very-short-patch-repair endonuclease